ncbi:MAG: polysaccharide deacetylase [Oscillospiraceae bacterium]|jgi:peptidoglycan/xylan/chitin deacetylase (PgdA/CDA1 family)|nr:polysaccharide deacetylase [Oscillospiraceae bacterium]
MKKHSIIKTLFATLLLAMVIGGLSASAEAEPYFTGVNDKLLPLKDATMPFLWNDKFYVPYTIFEENAELGIYVTHDKDFFRVTFWNKSNVLTFDYLNNVTFDSTKQYSERVIGKNNTIYVPIEFLCKQFNLGFDHINAAPVTILRIVSSSSLDGIDFREWVGVDMLRFYREYTGYYSPTPSGGGGTAPTRTPSPAPSPSALPEIKVVYLTFDDGPNGNTGKILDVLDEYGMKATFFMLGDHMEESPDTLRRIVGSEHGIGLHGYNHNEEELYGSPDSLASEIERANEALDSITGMKTRLFRFPWGSRYVNQALRDRVTQEGYRYWDWTIDALDHSPTESSVRSVAKNVIDGLAKSGSTAVVLMHDTANTAGALPQILAYIQKNGYIVRTITQSEMPNNFYKDVR